jgi:hypothetical protein
MANWASNSIAFYQEDGGNALLQAFYADVQKYVESGDDWVGHMLESNRVNTDEMYTRGFFQCCVLNSDHVRVDMETAWGPLPEVWDKMAEKYGLAYVYISEECGMSVYVNTDVSGRFFCDRYLLDYFVVEDLGLSPYMLTKYGERLRELSGETTYYEDFDDVLNDFKSLGFRGDNLEDLNEYLGKFNLRVHEFDSQE